MDSGRIAWATLAPVLVICGWKTLLGQTEWTKYANNPVIRVPGGCGQEWDCGSIDGVSVLLDGDTYRMWYVGRTLQNSNSVGYATSPDGINWTKHEGNPVIRVPGGCGQEWDCGSIDGVSVLLDGDTYRMWYVGRTLQNSNSVGYATSPDGINWTKHEGNPVIRVPGGCGQEWDCGSIDGVSVLLDGDTYRMWYVGRTLQNSNSVGYATSPDGINWTKHEGNPVIRVPGGCGQEWDCGSIDGVSVLLDGDTYRMWYVGRTLQNSNSVGYATSPDGINWTKHEGNPVIRVPGGCGQEWDCGSIDGVSVLLDGDTYRMWYVGRTLQNSNSVGYATSPNEAGIAADPRCGYAPLEIRFLPGHLGPYLSLLWDFGDGATSDEPNPIHIYEQPGSYFVHLRVTTLDGGKLVFGMQPVEVYASAPVAGFTNSPSAGRVPFEVRFTDSSSGEIVRRQWDFGDGTTSSETNPAHTFTRDGSYEVKLVVSGPCPESTANESLATNTVVAGALPFVALVQTSSRCVTVLLSSAVPFSGGELGIAYDSGTVLPTRIMSGPALPTAAQVLSEIDPPVNCDAEVDVQAGFTVGWINSLSGGEPTLPGTHELFVICFDASPGASLGDCSPLRFVSCLGVLEAPVRNIVTIENDVSATLFTRDGEVCLLPEQPFRRGDANADGNFDITDPIAILGCLFLGTRCFACPDAADANDDGFMDVTDPIYLLNWRFTGGRPPPPPFPVCSVDPEADELEECSSFKPCP